MFQKIKLLPVLAAAILILSACDTGTLNGSYSLNVSESGKISGYIKSELTPERYEFIKEIRHVQRSVVVHDITYTWNAGNCTMEDIVVTSEQELRPKYWAGQIVSFGSLDFADYEGAVFTGDGLIDSSYQLAIRQGNGNFGCINPGEYVQDSGFATTVFLDPSLNELGLEDWARAENMNISVGNIYPTDLPYFFALNSICAIEDGSCVTPDEVSDKLSELLGEDSRFSNIKDDLLNKGEFVDYLHDQGIETYKTASGSWGVKVPFTNQPFSSLYRWANNSPYAIIPSVANIDGVAISLESSYEHLVSGEDEIANPVNEFQIWEQESQNLAAFSQSVKIAGLILDTNGNYNKKKKTFSWSISGYGADAKLTDEKPSITFAPGIEISFKANSSKLTSATKALLKKKKAVINAYGDTLIGAVTNSSLSPDDAVANQTLATKRATAIKNYLVNTLKLSHNYLVVTTPSSDSGSTWAKASVNKAVISALGIPIA
ncbi:MAG: hypothetical protein RLZZ330_412 [Actinomycetota bacterium]|jgi:outer membrane protein OmpA-like peptidoglycan-associated protein